MLPRLLLVLVGVGLPASAASAREAVQPTATSELGALRECIERLQAEVTALRAAVARLELERHRDVIRQLNAELDAIRAEHGRLDEAERTRVQDLADLGEWLNREDNAVQERPDIRSAQSDLAAQAQQIDRKREAVRVRESELLRALHAEEQRTKALEGVMKQIGGKPNETL